MRSMSVFVDKILPAAIGEISGLIVALLGFYQWRKQQERTRRTEFIAAKRNVCEGFWNTLEEINLRFRESTGSNPQLFEQIKSANVYFLKHSLYFEDEEQAPINKDIEALERFRAALYAPGNEDVASVWEQTCEEFPVELDKELTRLDGEVQGLRQAIKSKVLAVMTQD
jgi:hypothetical protein